MPADTPTDLASRSKRSRNGNWFSRRRIVAVGGVLTVLQLFVLGFLVAGTYGVVKRYGPETVSFKAFYAAGQLANEGNAPLVYDAASLDDAEATLTHAGVHFDPFPYPPIYLLLCAPLARLPIRVAFGLFEATTLALYLIVVRRILAENGWSWLLPTLAFPATFWTIGFGQNSFLTAALLGAGTLLVDRRPALAGSFFGMLCFKPHLGLLVPVALLAGRRWGAIAAATITVGVLTALSVALFGRETWHHFLQYVLTSGLLSQFEGNTTNVFGSVSPFAAALALGLSYSHARLVQMAATSFSMLFVAWVWGTNASLPLRSAALAAGTLIAIPYALLYDVMFAGIAGAWLVRAGRTTGFAPWEEETLAAVYILPLFALQAGMVLRLPLAPLAGVGLVVVCATRVWRERDLLDRPTAGRDVSY